MDVLMAAAAAAPVSPWNAVTITTAVVATLGFVVAAGGLILGLYNARHQSRRDFPKPHWVTGWDVDRGRTTFTFVNEGRGEARLVELWVLAGVEGQKERWIQSEYFYGDMKFRRDDSLTFKDVWTRGRKVELRWRQEPNLHKVRRKRFAVPRRLSHSD